jgi:magnesium-transporting ATPase (P-type)
MVAGLLAFFLGDLKDGLVVYGLLLINGFIGFYQEIKALASLTGESIPVEKNAGVILNQDAPVHERINILLKEQP